MNVVWIYFIGYGIAAVIAYKECRDQGYLENINDSKFNLNLLTPFLLALLSWGFVATWAYYQLKRHATPHNPDNPSESRSKHNQL